MVDATDTNPSPFFERQMSYVGLIPTLGASDHDSNTELSSFTVANGGPGRFSTQAAPSSAAASSA